MAILSTDGTRILNNYDRFTGIPFNSTKVIKYGDGSTMDDSKVDNAIYFKVPALLGGGYAKRDYDGYIDVRWFGTPVDGVKEDHSFIQKACKVVNAIGGGSLMLPAGNYVFNYANKPSGNTSACVEIYSNTMVQLSKGANIKMKGNALLSYGMFSFKNAFNSSIVGGKLIGDRYEHDYTAAGTHEGGHGVIFEGESVSCSIVGSELCNFTGDGAINSPTFNFISTISESGLESGNLDAAGVGTVDATRLRTIGFTSLTGALVSARGYFGLYGTGFGGYGGLDNKYYDAYFYDAGGNFVKQLKQLKLYERVYVPTGATQAKFTFYKPATNTVFAINFRAEDYSQDLTIERCKLHDNRRQGISITGCQGFDINNNDFYNIGGLAGSGQVAKAAGTDPQGGIDIEDGYQLNQNINITNNRFRNNTGYNLVVVTAINVTVTNNFFSSNVNNLKYVSLSIGIGVENMVISNNSFEKGGIILAGDTIFSDNKLNELLLSTASESIYNNIYLSNNSLKNTRVRLQNSAIRQSGNKFISTVNNVKNDFLISIESSTELVNCSFIGEGTNGTASGGGTGTFKPSITEGCDFFTNKGATGNFNIPFGFVSNTKFRSGAWVYVFQGSTTDILTVSDCYFESYMQVGNDLKTLIVRNCTFNCVNNLQFGSNSLVKLISGFTGNVIIDNCTFIFTSSATNFNILDFNIAGTGGLVFTNNKFLGNSKPVGLKTSSSTSTTPFIIKNNSFNGCTKLLRTIDINEGNGDATGLFTVTGSGQTAINIPHSLGVIPVVYRASAESAAARTAGVTSVTADVNNIIVTITTPNTGGSLVYSWSAKI